VKWQVASLSPGEVKNFIDHFGVSQVRELGALHQDLRNHEVQNSERWKVLLWGQSLGKVSGFDISTLSKIGGRVLCSNILEVAKHDILEG
jgi:hypothetical protein